MSLYALREDGRAPVGKVVAVNGRDDAIAEAEALHGAGKARGFPGVDGRGLAAGYGAVTACAGADVAEDHEGGGLSLPALADVGASRLFADGVELRVVKQPPYAEVILAAGCADGQPLRQASCGLRSGHGSNASRLPVDDACGIHPA